MSASASQASPKNSCSVPTLLPRCSLCWLCAFTFRACKAFLAELQYLRGVVVNGNDGVVRGLRLAPGELKGAE